MSSIRAFLALMILLLAGACSVPGPGEAPDGVYDPYESANRNIHDFNLGLDRGGVRQASVALAALPEDVQTGLGNFADTLGTPKTVVNQILQGRLWRATKNTLRFGVNVLFGFGGLADVARDVGLPEDESDFGETLHVWGAPEGAYVVLPVLGPSTERDAVGEFVDFFTNPLDRVLTTPQRRVATTIRITDRFASRGRNSDVFDSVLYESADSYSQLRVIYLQNRRFELGYGDEVPGTEIDPMALDTEGF
ncbi:MAG: VacJ family lipoprotein [Paracoccaceae bacterium]|nr:VacJ family lipoprotein [Paracoccaceae bacterium]